MFIPFMIILRGISGAGKSTYAHKYYEKVTICSADDYFMCSHDGKYNFNPTMLTEAHTECYRKALRACSHGESVVIDNTNTSLWEMSPYVMLARAFKYNIEFIRFDVDPYIAFQRNNHGVPVKSVCAMAARIEELPPFWELEQIVKVD